MAGGISIVISQAQVEEIFDWNTLQDSFFAMGILSWHSLERKGDLDETPDQQEHANQWEMHRIGGAGVNAPQGICNLGTESGLEEMVKLIRQWLTTCSNYHQECGRDQDRVEGLPPLPTRVIDVGTLGQPHLRLHVPERGERDEYTCLSYCWGRGVPEFKTTTATVDDLRKHVPFAALPKTIQEAIVFTRQLKVRYLWVDALCIIQDDASSPRDWQLEAARFGGYYQNALCTLAATGSRDSSEGLFRQNNDLLYPSYFCTRVHRGSRGPLCFTWVSSVLDTTTVIYQSPLLERGWAAQERILSPRVVHFTNWCVIWECSQLIASERFPDESSCMVRDSIGSISNIFSRRDKMEPLLEDHWIRFCHWYVNMKFSRLSDRLPALSGVAQRIQDCTGLKYYAGLWGKHIAKGLAWYIRRPQAMPDDQVLRRPSWSWAASTGDLVYWGGNLGPYAWKHAYVHDQGLQILDVEVEYTGRDTDGLVTAGVITTDGMLGTLNLAELGYKQESENFWRMAGDKDEVGVRWDRVGSSTEVLRSYLCLRVALYTTRVTFQVQLSFVGALILAPDNSGLHGPVKYRRVGYGIFSREVWQEGELGRRVIKLV
ncbi:HET domain-containing protein [Fusarium keratoplasticum]|uniref:HET domain-containing protein n=1 Tax=Fusarium keratoplasticum TaxID=1328300 RepID=A0ACC0QG38_9HYPO|nr:HET domain-containing protein [Fusarium keratoplasticum]KAI8652310.1 HET domain-containing protein [Fusarium keratoplasticum]